MKNYGRKEIKKEDKIEYKIEDEVVDEIIEYPDMDEIIKDKQTQKQKNMNIKLMVNLFLCLKVNIEDSIM